MTTPRALFVASRAARRGELGYRVKPTFAGPGYLIRSAGGKTISGRYRESGGDDRRIERPAVDDLLNDTHPEDDIVPRLAELGITVSDVDLIISTHFDFDHCGRHDVFAPVGTESWSSAVTWSWSRPVRSDPIRGCGICRDCATRSRRRHRARAGIDAAVDLRPRDWAPVAACRDR